MSRIRTIKPDFFVDEEVARLGPLCRLLFIGMWTHADRAGRLEHRPQRLKAQVLPYDQVEIEQLLSELEAAPGRFIFRYEVASRRYIQIRTFEHHQRPNHREPPSTIPSPMEEPLIASTVPSGVDAAPTSTDTPRARPGTPGRKGREGKGNGREGKEEDESPLTLSREARPRLFPELLDQFAAAWRDRYRKHYVSTPKDRSHLGRLLQGLTPEDAAALPACFLAYIRDPDPFVAETQRHSLAFFCSSGGLNKYRTSAPIRSAKEAKTAAVIDRFVNGGRE